MNYLRHLYVQVLVATLLGGICGVFWPNFAEPGRIIGESFIALIKMLIGPVIFCTVVTGIATTGDMKKVGRVGLKALLYFEIVSTIALGVGLIAVNWFRPGDGFNVSPSSLDGTVVSQYAQKPGGGSLLEIIRHIIPETFTDAFSAHGDLLQVLLVAILFAYAATHLGEAGKKIVTTIGEISQVFFKMVSVVMNLAPLGAFGAMAFTIGKYGIHSLIPMANLMLTVYASCLFFVVIILGGVSAALGFNVFRYLYYIREELLLVLGTSSSESALVPMMSKLEKLGCSKSVVGLVIPAGYSFNLDGTNIYLTIAAMFIAQAMNIHLTLEQQLSLLLVAVLTSKGASGVTGAGFITLAATLAVVPTVPVAGMALILGIDRFMSEARALTNMVGNGIATIAISRWEGELDRSVLKRELQRSQEAK